MTEVARSRRPHHLRRAQIVGRPRADVFAFFAAPGNLEAITPPDLRFEIVTPEPIVMREGALIEYRLSLLGIQFGWLTRIEVFEPCERFVDVQLKGPYRSWRHTHVFSDVPGGTLVCDDVEYEIGLGPLGRVARAVFVGPRLERIFEHRGRRVAELLSARGPAGATSSRPSSSDRPSGPGSGCRTARSR